MHRLTRQAPDAEQHGEDYPNLLKHLGVDEVPEEERIIPHRPQKPRGVVVHRVLDEVALPVVLDPGVRQRPEQAHREGYRHRCEEPRPRLEPRLVKEHFGHSCPSPFPLPPSLLRLSSTISLSVIGITSTLLAPDCALMRSAMRDELCDAITEIVRPSTA